MKSRYLGMIAVVSAVLIAACVSASEDKSVLVESNSTVNQHSATKVFEESSPVLVAATETPALDGGGFPIPQQKKKSTAAEIAPLASDKSPYDVALAAEKGSLKNPYSYQPMNNDLVEAGKKKYMGVSCNGCHGGNGGGGMCPPLSNETWVYGSDDDTLFRIIALGTDELQKAGYTRTGRENVVGPMPGHGKIVKTEDDMWRIIYFIRANFRGDAKNINW